MIYKKENIDISLVQCPYEEEQGYIHISDEYTNNVLKLSGYSDIDEREYIRLCKNDILINHLEAYSMKNIKYAFFYTREVVKDRYPLLEPLFATDAEISYWYAFNVLRDRFELGEPIIATSAEHSYRYAKYVLNGRFELGEEAISTEQHFSYYYNLLLS